MALRRRALPATIPVRAAALMDATMAGAERCDEAFEEAVSAGAGRTELVVWVMRTRRARRRARAEGRPMPPYRADAERSWYFVSEAGERVES